jgi:hypothetical protein
VISVSKEGHATAKIALARNMSGWYIANILVGGVVGFIVDAADGAMFTLTPDSIHAYLKATQPGESGAAHSADATTKEAPAHTRVRVAHSVEDVKACSYLGEAPSTPCPDNPSAEKCAAWHGLQLGGNTVLPTAGGKFLVYRCTETTPP